jgi:quinoprotein glucose dehydrogenase
MISLMGVGYSRWRRFFGQHYFWEEFAVQMFFRGRFGVAWALAVLAVTPTVAQEPYNPFVAPASDEGESYIPYIGIPDGFQTELFAAEPMLANPVSFYIDHQGQFYVTETFRIKKGVLDMRDHTDWMTEDRASRTVEDRLVAMKRNMGDEFAAQSVEHDRIRMIFDDDGDGRADRATVFADGFKDTLAGLGSGVLVDRGDVYYTCIPDLWKLRDNDGDGVADVRDVLSSGYGVHFNFYGHDLHGLRKGPDGRIYFSIGDRGFHVKTQEGEVLAFPDEGAILRCNPDGSELEVYHSGLRNPQEITFDNYGNLFTGDNNSDGGDQARWIYGVEGGDSGWRIGYQWLNTPYVRGPWNLEKMWHPQHDGQPANIVPPLLNIGAGPSGVTHYPGTGLSDDYQNHLFMSDFRGDASRSLIHTFTVEPRGAFYEVVGRRDFASNILVTDIDFGMDGGLYISDWVSGWGMTGKGRIYRVFNPALEDDPLVAETKRLLGEGMMGRSLSALGKLLSHADQRVRLEAQYALADRGAEAVDTLHDAALSSENLFARLHGIWGLSQLMRAGDDDARSIRGLLNDKDAEVRAQAAKVLGDDPSGASTAALVKALDDSNSRVRFFAATSLGKQPRDENARDAVDALAGVLSENNNVDSYLRHGAVMGLLGQADLATLVRLAESDSAAVRLGSLLTLRRLKSPEVARFLGDDDAYVAEEAVRAINDTPIPGAFPALAALSQGNAADWAPIATSRRVLNAHLRLTGESNAMELARIATLSDATPALRREALQHLYDWDAPYVFDRITGEWRPMAAGDPGDVRAAMAASDLESFDTVPEDVAVMLARIAGKYQVIDLAGALAGAVDNDNLADGARIQALHALGEMNANEFSETLASAVASDSSALRIEAISYLAKDDPAGAVETMRNFLEDGSIKEKQNTLMALQRVDHSDATALLGEWLDRLVAGELEREIVLDVLEAAGASGDESLGAKAGAWSEGLRDGTFAGRFVATVAGGDAAKGETIFFTHTETSCQRCHALDGRGGAEEVGPDLTGVGGRVTREYIVESIVESNAQIAEGFENVTLNMKDGTEHRGRVVSETDEAIELEPLETFDVFDPFGEAAVGAHSEVDVVAEGEVAVAKPTISIQKSDVEARARNLSAMPDELYRSLSMVELRDLVEFLATRK